MMVTFTPLDYYAQPNSVLPEAPLEGMGPLAKHYKDTFEHCMDHLLELPFRLTELMSCVEDNFGDTQEGEHVYSPVRGFAAIPMVPQGIETPLPGYYVPTGHITVDTAKIMRSKDPNEFLLPEETFPDDELLLIINNPIRIA